MGRLRGFLWLLAGLMIASLAGIVAFVTISKAAAQGRGDATGGPQAKVVVAARAVAARTVLTAEDLALRELPIGAVPESALHELTAAEGKLTLSDLYADEIVVPERLLDANIVSNDQQTALHLSEDQVLMAIPAGDLMSQAGLLKSGDRVDLLVSVKFPGQGLPMATPSADRKEQGASGSNEEELATFCILQNIEVAGLVGVPKGDGTALESSARVDPESTPAAVPNVQRPESILIIVSPQDALVLKYALDADGIQDILLRAAGVERQFETQPVNADYVVNRYQIPSGLIR